MTIEVNLTAAACLFNDRLAFLSPKIKDELEDALRFGRDADRLSKETTTRAAVDYNDELGNIAWTIEQHLLSQLTASTLKREASAGATFILLDDLLRNLVSDVNQSFRRVRMPEPLPEKRTSLIKGPDIGGGVAASLLIAAAANGFRHMNEWLDLSFDDDTNCYTARPEQLASILPLLKATKQTRISRRVPFDALILLASNSSENATIEGIIHAARAIAEDVFTELDQVDAWESAKSLKRPSFWEH